MSVNSISPLSARNFPLKLRIMFKHEKCNWRLCVSEYEEIHRETLSVEIISAKSSSIPRQRLWYLSQLAKFQSAAWLSINYKKIAYFLSSSSSSCIPRTISRTYSLLSNEQRTNGKLILYFVKTSLLFKVFFKLSHTDFNSSSSHVETWSFNYPYKSSGLILPIILPIYTLSRARHSSSSQKHVTFN